jgi:hypothetical protein
VDMYGLLGFLFPRKSKLLHDFITAAKAGNASRYLEEHQNEIPKLLKEIDALKVDEQEQEIMKTHRKQIEDASYPLGFSDD